MSDAATAAPPDAPDASIAARAAERAEAAAADAGVCLEGLRTLAHMQEASALVRSIWGEDHLPVNLLRAVAHSGGYVTGARRGHDLAGVAMAFLGRADGRLCLHSHVVGVVPGAQGRSVGYALKLHQRAWALQREVPTVVWTFDPLLRRNAYFNLTKLGAVGARYEPNFYGAMRDELNGGDESDRLVVHWRLADGAAVSAAEGQRREAETKALVEAGAHVLLDIGEGAEPAPGTAAASGDALLLCRIPEDFHALRAADPALGRRWRTALRQALGEAFTNGYEATGMTRDGWYTLTLKDTEVAR